MQRQVGIHFYINIANYNSIILDEENRTGQVTHAIHALDTFFSSVESFGKKYFKDSFVVEKITGSRLHMYVIGDLQKAYEVVKTVSVYAYRLSKYLNNDIPKYKTLKDFFIQIGSAYGRFYEFEFSIGEEFSEMTTIGYAANYAAKIQTLTNYSKMSITEEMYDALSQDEKTHYEKVSESSIKKYGHECFYTASLPFLSLSVPLDDEDIEAAKKYANSDNLSDIEFTGVRKPLNFRSLNRTQCKRIEGIPVYADVRGFTNQFEDNDSNLEEMVEKTQTILESMYMVSTQNGGIHVQFQGDRELSLYHNIPGETTQGYSQPEQRCYKQAVLAAMRMIDAVKPLKVHIGVGEDFGTIFATKIGARGEKDNILLGETVINADLMEDKKAGEDQVAITKTVYDGLKVEDSGLASYFKPADECYIATIGYQQYMRDLSYKQLKSSTARNAYNGAWGDVI